MKPRNRMQQLVAVLGAAGVSAVMGLPAVAQGVVNNGAANNGVLNPNPSIFNETPYNRAQVSPQQVPSQCAGLVPGGVGGPVDNSTQQRSSSDNNTSRSSDAVASQGIPGNYQGIPGQDTGSMSSNTMSGNNNHNASRNEIKRQFDAENPAAGVAFRANGPAGTSGKEVSMNLQAFSRSDRNNNQASNPALAPQTNISAAPLPAECAP